MYGAKSVLLAARLGFHPFGFPVAASIAATPQRSVLSTIVKWPAMYTVADVATML
jgi:hypothetical protein